MYEQGYTSLGQTHNTFKNPLLERSDGGYDEAWKLVDGKEERVGRETTEKKVNTADADATKKEVQATSSQPSLSAAATSQPRRKVAIIISKGTAVSGTEAMDIGPFLCSALDPSQYAVSSLMTLGMGEDPTQQLADCIRRCSYEHDLVLVCGGSGT
jgi:hypothetical protein